MKAILAGNEAVTRGCYEYGIHVATAYSRTLRGVCDLVFL